MAICDWLFLTTWRHIVKWLKWLSVVEAEEEPPTKEPEEKEMHERVMYNIVKSREIEQRSIPVRSIRGQADNDKWHRAPSSNFLITPYVSSCSSVFRNLRFSRGTAVAREFQAELCPSTLCTVYMFTISKTLGICR